MGEWSPKGSNFDKLKFVFSSNSLTWIYLVCLIEGADVQLLPASFRALEASLGLSPSRLAMLSLAQALTGSIAALFWGNLVDRGLSRKFLLVTAMISWAILTMCLGLVSCFEVMVILRIGNGIALAALMPISQSIIAEVTAAHERGFFFGLFGFMFNVGGLLGSSFTTAVSNENVMGHEGWRLAFLVVAVVSALMALGTAAFMVEPAQTLMDRSQAMNLFSQLKAHFRINTFTVIVLQGLVGAVPWNALSFATMYFQYCGISDKQSASLGVCMGAGCTFGVLLGGAVGDHLSSISRFHGRALTAQFSVLVGVPVTYALFNVLPGDVSSYHAYGLLLISFGLTASWCAGGVNRPILCEMVNANHRGSVISWLVALEGSTAALCGSPLVAFLAEKHFGYVPQSGQVWNMPLLQREANAHALAKSITICTMIPWILCFIFYGCLHWTYKQDLADSVEGQEEGIEKGGWPSALKQADVTRSLVDKLVQ